MVDEGPAYALGLWSRLSPIDVWKVTVTAGAARP
jgi:hypothetical protein